MFHCETNEMTTQQRWFITFGGPTPEYHERVQELCESARQITNDYAQPSAPFFHNILGYTEKDLMQDTEFWQQHGDFIQQNKRGYGYWMWKPYVIQKTLKMMNDNDVLFYADVGCQFNIHEQSMKRMHDYVNFVTQNETGIIAFKTVHPEMKYNKRHTIETLFNKNMLNPCNCGCVLNVAAKRNSIDSTQHSATVVISRKTTHSVHLINEWFRLATAYNYSLINDEVRQHNIPENEMFHDHRHDQSVFSLLTKIYGAYVMFDETYVYPQNPILGTRTRTPLRLSQKKNDSRCDNINTHGFFIKNPEHKQ